MFSIIFQALANLIHAKAKEIHQAKPEIKKVAKVTQVIKGPYLRGRVKFKDRYFHAFCQESIEVLRGAHVEVIEDKGTYLIVKPLDMA